jgi:uncharacterized protein YjdB
MIRKILMAVAVPVLAAGCGDAGTEARTEPVVRVEVIAPSSTLATRTTLQLSARTIGDDGSVLAARPVTWTSSDTLLAKVSPSGLVSALAAGTVTIRAESGGKGGQTVLTVVPEPVSWVQITPPGDLVRAGGTTLQLAAIAWAQDGTELKGRPAAWSSSDTAVAVVSASGMLHARAAGSARIRAAVDGKTAEALVMVPSLIHRIEVSTDSLRMGDGDEAPVVARALAQDGTPLERALTWSSSNSSVASVSAAGVVHGVGSGTAFISASSEGRSATVPVQVGTWGRRALVAVNDSALPAVGFRKTETSAGGATRTIRYQVNAGRLRALGLTERYELAIEGFLIPPDSPPVAASYVSRGTFSYDALDTDMVLYPEAGTSSIRGRFRADGKIEITWRPDPAAPPVTLLFAAP